MTNAVLYTDGSATVRPDGTFYCGYAYVFVVDGKPVIGKAFPGMGTINQAEMCAVYKGMEDAESHNIYVTEVYTDSTYVINGLVANTEKYETNEWTNSQGSEVVNKEMWINLIEFTKKLGRPIPAVHVKGHTGQPFNELCDKLAKEAAMSQKPVIDYMDIRMCEELGFYIPRTIEPVPLPAKYCDPMHVPSDIVSALGEYTDDRAKCCFIDYPGISKTVVSKGVSYWMSVNDTPVTDELQLGYNVHPVVTDGGKELPFYKYMTESGTPFDVVINSGSTIMWQGTDFNEALLEAIDDVLIEQNYSSCDLIIASYNLASAKKYQGIYFGGYSAQDNEGPVLEVYRTERMPHGKVMRIPRKYLEVIHKFVSDCPDMVIGLITSTTMMGMVMTSSKGGMMVGSAVIPHTITIGGDMTINMDKPDRPNVRFTGFILAQLCIDRAIGRVKLSANLDSVIPKQDYIKPEPDTTAVDVKVSDKLIITEVPFSTSTHQIDGECVEVDTMDKLIQEYLETSTRMSELLKTQQVIIQKLVDLCKYPPMTPDKIKEIEKRTREEMLQKFNSMFK